VLAAVLKRLKKRKLAFPDSLQRIGETRLEYISFCKCKTRRNLQFPKLTVKEVLLNIISKFHPPGMKFVKQLRFAAMAK
jgi:hypothetical protein